MNDIGLQRINRRLKLAQSGRRIHCAETRFYSAVKIGLQIVTAADESLHGDPHFAGKLHVDLRKPLRATLSTVFGVHMKDFHRPTLQWGVVRKGPFQKRESS